MVNKYIQFYIILTSYLFSMCHDNGYSEQVHFFLMNALMNNFCTIGKHVPELMPVKHV